MNWGTIGVTGYGARNTYRAFVTLIINLADQNDAGERDSRQGRSQLEHAETRLLVRCCDVTLEMNSFLMIF